MSRGTVQSALTIMRDDKAIETQAKGKLGTYLTAKNENTLLSYLDSRGLVCAMPLPYTKHYEGLATALYKSFSGSPLRLNLAYVSGSLNRLDGLLNNRYNFIITSGLTADYLEENYQVKKIFELPTESYLSEHVIVFSKGSDKVIKEGMRIGVDTKSLDYALLTNEALNKRHVKRVGVPYNQIVQQIISGKIDAAIWNKDEIMSKNYKVSYREIDSPSVRRASQAVLIGGNNSDFIQAVVRQRVHTSEIMAIQKGVVSGSILPEY